MIEIQDQLTFARWEYAWKRMQRAREADRMDIAAVGMRAARSRDPKLLKVLEQAANLMDAACEAQMGRTRRAAEIEGFKIEPTEVQLVKEAYRMVDQGTPIQNFCWIYATAAIVLGYVV